MFHRVCMCVCEHKREREDRQREKSQWVSVMHKKHVVSSHCLMVLDQLAVCWSSMFYVCAYCRWACGTVPDVLESDPVKEPCLWASHGSVLITAIVARMHVHLFKLNHMPIDRLRSQHPPPITGKFTGLFFKVCVCACTLQYIHYIINSR